MGRYSLGQAYNKLGRPMEQIKNVMRYSDVDSVSIQKWKGKDKDGNPVDRFHTSIHSNTDEEYYDDFVEEEE